MKKYLWLIAFFGLMFSKSAYAVDIWMDVDTAIASAPINIFPLTDDTDFKTREVALVYNQAGLDLVWNFVTTAGVMTQTAVTPTETAGAYDWVNQGDGMYSVEIPATSGAGIKNDTEGHGWFTGYATGVLPWRGPIIGFRAAATNNSLIDMATITVTAGTVSDKTGYSLTVAPPTASEIQAEMEENGASILDTLGDRILGTLAAGSHTAQTGDSYAVVTHANYGLAVIEDQTDEIGALGAGLTGIPFRTIATGFDERDVLNILAAKLAGKRTRTVDGVYWDQYYFAIDDLTGVGTAVIEEQDVDVNGQQTGTITITPPL